MRPIRGVSAGALTALLLSGCAGPEGPIEQTSPDSPAEPPRQTIVVTTTILGSVVQDMVRCVEDPSLAVEVLMPVGVDPHDFQPSSSQLALMVESGTVIANGLGLEMGLIEPLEQVEADGATVIRVAEWIEPLPFGLYDTDHEHSADDGHDHGEDDPHFWFDMSKMAEVAARLGDTLAPLYGPGFAECGQQVAAEIVATDREMGDLFAGIPEQSRVLVTDHDAFGYFADHYGFRVLGVVIPGGSTLAEPSSEDLARLVESIKAEGVSVIFGNHHVHSDLLLAVAEEAGGDLSVVDLYVGSIGEVDGPAGDYRSMMRENARLIVAALAG